MDRMIFSKTGRAKYISHLDLMRTFQRIFMRSGVNIKHTEGFNPHEYISIALPLSLGTESEYEILDFQLIDNIDFNELKDRMNKASPEGIEILDIFSSTSKVKDIKWIEADLLLYYDLKCAKTAINDIVKLFNSDVVMVNKKTKRGFADLNLKEGINKISFDAFNDEIIKIKTIISAQNPTFNPDLILKAIDQNISECMPNYYSIKRIKMFDESMKIFR